MTVVGFVLWCTGLRRIGAERATFFSGLIPVAVACTAPLAGAGTFGAPQAVGGVLVGAGWRWGPGSSAGGAGQRQVSRMTRATRAGSSFIGTWPQPGSRTSRAPGMACLARIP